MSKAWDIPYVVAEASHAPKRLNDEWSEAETAVCRALSRAYRIFSLNADDESCLRTLLGDESHRLAVLPPFLDIGAIDREVAAPRETVAGRFNLDPSRIWLVSCAMFRPGDKFESYRLLSEALQRMPTSDWQLLVIGDGSEKQRVNSLFKPLGALRVRYAGALDTPDIHRVFKACDLFVWPAFREAFGMAMLEAQACGLPVVAGNRPGVAAIVRNGQSGLLGPVTRTDIMAANIESLLQDKARRRHFGRTGRELARREHDIPVASDILARHLDAIGK